MMVLLQNTMPQGTWVGRPHSSPLMKLAMRPKNRPIGAQGAIRSPSRRMSILLARANSTMAMATPIMPPWKLIPPFQILNASSGCESRVSVL